MLLGQALARAGTGDLRRAVCKAAVISTLADTFSWEEGHFTLSVNIDDGITQTVAHLGRHLMEQLIGTTAAEYASMEPETQQQLDKSMETKLAMLEGMLTLEFDGGRSAIPTIVSVEQPQPRDCWACLQRVTKLLQQHSVR